MNANRKFDQLCARDFVEKAKEAVENWKSARQHPEYEAGKEFIENAIATCEKNYREAIEWYRSGAW